MDIVQHHNAATGFFFMTCLHIDRIIPITVCSLVTIEHILERDIEINNTSKFHQGLFDSTSRITFFKIAVLEYSLHSINQSINQSSRGKIGKIGKIPLLNNIKSKDTSSFKNQKRPPALPFTATGFP